MMEHSRARSGRSRSGGYRNSLECGVGFLPLTLQSHDLDACYSVLRLVNTRHTVFGIVFWTYGTTALCDFLVKKRHIEIFSLGCIVRLVFVAVH